MLLERLAAPLLPQEVTSTDRGAYASLAFDTSLGLAV